MREEELPSRETNNVSLQQQYEEKVNTLFEKGAILRFTQLPDGTIQQGSLSEEPYMRANIFTIKRYRSRQSYDPVIYTTTSLPQDPLQNTLLIIEPNQVKFFKDLDMSLSANTKHVDLLVQVLKELTPNQSDIYFNTWLDTFALPISQQEKLPSRPRDFSHRLARKPSEQITYSPLSQEAKIQLLELTQHPEFSFLLPVVKSMRRIGKIYGIRNPEEILQQHKTDLLTDLSSYADIKISQEQLKQTTSLVENILSIYLRKIRAVFKDEHKASDISTYLSYTLWMKSRVFITPEASQEEWVSHMHKYLSLVIPFAQYLSEDYLAHPYFQRETRRESNSTSRLLKPPSKDKDSVVENAAIREALTRMEPDQRQILLNFILGKYTDFELLEYAGCISQARQSFMQFFSEDTGETQEYQAHSSSLILQEEIEEEAVPSLITDTLDIFHQTFRQYPIKKLIALIDQLSQREKHVLLHRFGYVQPNLNPEQYRIVRMINTSQYQEDLVHALEHILDIKKEGKSIGEEKEIADIIRTVEATPFLYVNGKVMRHGESREQLIELMLQKPYLLNHFRPQTRIILEAITQSGSEGYASFDELAVRFNMQKRTVQKLVENAIQILKEPDRFCTTSGFPIRRGTTHGQILLLPPAEIANKIEQLNPEEKALYMFISTPDPETHLYPSPEDIRNFLNTKHFHGHIKALYEKLR